MALSPSTVAGGCSIYMYIRSNTCERERQRDRERKKKPKMVNRDKKAGASLVFIEKEFCINLILRNSSLMVKCNGLSPFISVMLFF